jgi:hypothetical protein
LKKTLQKKAGGVTRSVGPEFKPWYLKRKKKEEEHCKEITTFSLMI